MHETTRTERQPMNVISVERPLQFKVFFKHIKEHLPETNHFKIISMVKILGVSVVIEIVTKNHSAVKL